MSTADWLSAETPLRLTRLLLRFTHLTYYVYTMLVHVTQYKRT